ncbi:putative short-chain type dehydrogenase [Thozetella sp. PMI_491]|nr:putative short-chain type dehydrogenase [Thozetella sp. PMI_491]
MPPPQGTPNPLEGPGDYTVTKTVHDHTYPAINPSKIDHSGHAVLISGSSRGIGKAAAHSFARAGASFIAVTGRSPPTSLVAELEAAAETYGRAKPKVLALSMEVTNESSIQQALARIEEEFGRLDVVVSNAGALGESARVLDSSPDVWWNTMNVNLRGPYLIYKYFIPLLLKTGGLATIINVASVGAHLTTPGLSAYQGSKLALLRLSEHVSEEYSGQGLLTYSVHPGNIPTDMLTSAGEVPAALMVAFTETEDLPADTVAYLSAEKRTWLAGRYVNCTWDIPELDAQKDNIVEEDKLKVKLAI